MHLDPFVPTGRITGAGAMRGAAAKNFIDVSSYAHSALIFGDLTMEAEAFGVAVTRRPDATRRDNLSACERARLLDVLWHAQKVQMDCMEGQCTFHLWTISSDARDMQPRNLYLNMRRLNGRFAISLSAI